MATDIDGLTYDGNIRAWLVCRRAFEKSDESASWDWTGDICAGPISGNRRLVGSQAGEVEEAAV